MTVTRSAVISYHSSPLMEPGAGDAGGMTVYVRGLADALARRGVHTDIFTRAIGDVPLVSSLSEGVRVISIQAGPRTTLDQQSLRAHVDDFADGIRAFAIAQRARYDVVHSHYWHSGLAAATLADAWGVPLVHSHHTLGRVKNRFLAPGDTPEPVIRLDGEGRVIAAADVLVASTDEEWGHLSCLYGASHDRVKTLHPGVDHEVFHPGDRDAARDQLGIRDELVVLFVARIQKLKGLDLAIAAVDELRSALDRPIRLYVVGGPSGPGGDAELARLEDLVRDRGLTDVVRFLGPQSHDHLPVFYRAADVLAVCSHSESFGLAALEAQACGTPVVATAVGGLSHIVGDGESGFLVDTRDPSVFAARLKTLLSDDQLRGSFRRVAARRAKAFSWQRTGDALLELYECLVGEQQPEVCTC